MQLGRSAFHKKVKELTGHTPADYLLEARMQHAANKLLTTELSVAEIAYLSGFRKPSYFNQKFKERFQCTPSQYRKSQSSVPMADADDDCSRHGEATSV